MRSGWRCGYLFPSRFGSRLDTSPAGGHGAFPRHSSTPARAAQLWFERRRGPRLRSGPRGLNPGRWADLGSDSACKGAAVLMSVVPTRRPNGLSRRASLVSGHLWRNGAVNCRRSVERSEDPPLSWTPPKARQCAGSGPWRRRSNDGSGERSRRSSRRKRCGFAGRRSAPSRRSQATLDLTETALREWVKRADIDAGKGPPEALTTAEREELARLRRDNKRLTMERDILKAAATFFAKESE